MTNQQYKQTEIGEIPENWNVLSMAQICDVVTDYVANGSFASLKEHVKYSDIPDYAVLIRLVDYNNSFQGNFVYVKQEGYEFLKKSKLLGGEIVISNVGEYAGTVFRVPYMEYKMTLGPNSITLKTNQDDTFYYYWLKSNFGQSALRDIRSGSAVPKFNKTDFKTILAPQPPKEEQQQIASTLSSIDDKIELNHKMNRILEDMGQALFKRWFIDFEFPDDNGKPYKSSGGEMVDSELGQIPKAWKVVFLPEVAKIQKGLSYKGKDLVDSGDTALVGLKCFERGGGFRKNGFKLYDGDYKEEQKLNPGDLVVAMTDLTQAADVLGKPAIIPTITGINTLIASLDLSIIKPNTSEIDEYFLYLLLSRQESQDFLFGYSNGSTVLHLSVKGLNEFKMVKPQQQALSAFQSIVQPLFKRLINQDRESGYLEEMRDSLLPRLISGKLRIN